MNKLKTASISSRQGSVGSGAKGKPIARRPRSGAGLGWGVVAWAATLLLFAPVGWMALTSFHSEAKAATNPPSPFAALTTANYHELLSGGALPYLINSATASIGSTLVVLALALPAAYALTVRPVEKSSDVMFFFLSTKFLPAIGALLPVYLIVKRIGSLDSIWVLIVLYTAMNLPIALWMLCSFLREIPAEIFEAAAMDGANLPRVLWQILRPLAMPGIAATSLICFIFSWNEFLLAVNLTSTSASTAPIYLVGFITSQGFFFAKLCAASTLLSLPVLVAGFSAQDKLVRGLSLGAVK